MSITITEKAVLEIQRVMQEQKINPADHVLDVGVAGGGCSGFQYKLGFKERSELDPLNETSFKFGDLEAVVHNKAMLFLEGTTVDFHEGLDRRGFVFNNPNATKGCGCGQSFNV